MKKILISLLLISFISHAQKYITLPLNTENKICYAKVVDDTSKTQSKLYNDTKEYILLNYTSRDFPTILDDKNERIYIKGKFKVPHKKYSFPFFVKKKWWDLVYTAKFYFKDGKYKYEIIDLFIVRKTATRIQGNYWGTGYTSTVTEGEVIKRDMEFMYGVKRYTKKFAMICWKVDEGVKAEIANYEKYMKQENDQKKW